MISSPLFPGRLPSCSRGWLPTLSGSRCLPSAGLWIRVSWQNKIRRFLILLYSFGCQEAELSLVSCSSARGGGGNWRWMQRTAERGQIKKIKENNNKKKPNTASLCSVKQYILEKNTSAPQVFLSRDIQQSHELIAFSCNIQVLLHLDSYKKNQQNSLFICFLPEKNTFKQESERRGGDCIHVSYDFLRTKTLYINKWTGNIRQVLFFPSLLPTPHSECINTYTLSTIGLFVLPWNWNLCSLDGDVRQEAYCSYTSYNRSKITA